MDLSCAQWRKASRSSSNGGACLEVARNFPRVVAIRDSKDPDGPKLVLSPDDWRALIVGVKAGRFGLV
jgi:hypothetical protein